MLTYFIAHTDILLIAFAQLLYSKLRYLPVVISNLAILSGSLLGVNKILLLEISAMLSAIYVTIHNRKFKISSLFYFVSISIGCFMIAVRETSANFLRIFITSICCIDNTHIDAVIYLYTLIFMLLIIGFIPFAEWMMYLFSISNALFKMTCFVIPTFLSLDVMQELMRSDNLYIFRYFGASICFYSFLCLFFNKDFRVNFVYVITYFYGLQIMQSSVSVIQPNNWIICSILTISCCDNFMSKRIAKYKYGGMRNIFFSNNIDKLLSVFYFLLLIVTFSPIYYILSIEENIMEIIAINLAVCFFAKILCIAFVTKQRTGYNRYIDIHRTFRFVLILLISSILLINNAVSYLHISSYRILVISIFVFTMTMLFSYAFAKTSQPYFLTSRMYFNVVVEIFRAFKVGCLITSTTISDFFKTLKRHADSELFSSSLQKIADILYGKHIYFYIYFLVQMLIVLAIECVIT